MNWIDWTVVVLLGLGALGGLRRGLVQAAFGLAGAILGAALAYVYASPGAVWAEARFGAVSKTASALAGALPLPAEAAAAPVRGLGADRAGQIVSSLPWPEPYRRAVAEAVSRRLAAWSAQGIDTVGEVIAYAVAWLAITALAAVTIFVAVRLAAWALAVFIGQALRWGGVGLTLSNRLAGAVFGAALVALQLTFFFGLLAPLLAGGRAGLLGSALAGSRLAPYFIRAYATLLPAVLSLGGKG